jgi:outer membrane protein TolC
MPRTEFVRLVDELIKRKLPSFSVFEVRDVEQGILASVIADVASQIARRVALNIQRILLGEEPDSIPVNLAVGEQLKINMETARAIDVYPDWRVLVEAELINEERTDIERKLSLSSAVQEAVDVNLDLIARERFVAAGSQDVKKARSKLLPQINLFGTGMIIDEDRAEASFGSQAERTLSGSVTATQVIFSEPAWANLSIQKSLQKTREWDYEQLRLDIVLAASTAYLNVLRAKTYERIQKDNLKRIRTNFGIARVRESTGMAGPAEVFRWESELATNQKDLLQAEAQRQIAEIQLNRLLHRPLEEPFITLEEDLSEQVLYTSEEYLRLTRNLKFYEIFRKFMVQEGLIASPELASLNSAIAVQERILRSASNSLWLPTLALQGEVSHIFSKGGAGSSLSLPPLFPFPEIDDTSWNVGLSLSFPLFKGGEKLVVRTKAKKELEYLNFQREAIKEKIEQRILSAIILTGTSYVSIEQARRAAEAGNKSFEVVQNAYTQGAVSIIHLLDAQNAAFKAEQVAANAVYDFLLDMMEMERSTGRFEFFMNEEEGQAFLERMKAFFKRHGINEERQ